MRKIEEKMVEAIYDHKEFSHAARNGYYSQNGSTRVWKANHLIDEDCGWDMVVYSYSTPIARISYARNEIMITLDYGCSLTTNSRLSALYSHVCGEPKAVTEDRRGMPKAGSLYELQNGIQWE